MVPWTVPLEQCPWCSRPRMNVEGSGVALCWLQFWMFAILSPPEDLPEPDLFPQGCGGLMCCMQKQLGKAFWQKDRNWASGIFGPCFCREPSERRNVWKQSFPHSVPHFGVPDVRSMIQPWRLGIFWCRLMSFPFQSEMLSICLHHSCRCCSAAWGCEAFELLHDPPDRQDWSYIRALACCWVAMLDF